MPAMNYKAATGVRARGDLSANTRPPAAALTAQELITIASYLAGAARRGKKVHLSAELCARAADAILEVLNRPTATTVSATTQQP